jgi:DNA-binding YbaB/EbfC family protein
MADFMKILQQAKDMQDRFQKVQEELQQITVSGSAGGGMVTADVNGTGQIKKIKLDSSVVNPATSRCWKTSWSSPSPTRSRKPKRPRRSTWAR